MDDETQFYHMFGDLGKAQVERTGDSTRQEHGK